tara:strand:- start:1865 stop:2203 length:339 start_codon:yes stop_codon:yes gene_type:complete
MELNETLLEFDEAAERMIELGNRLIDADDESDRWEVASGLLAGAVHFWLYTRQPCGEPYCESCTDIDTADKRVRLLIEEVRRFAQESEYFHTRWMPMQDRLRRPGEMAIFPA